MIPIALTAKHVQFPGQLHLVSARFTEASLDFGSHIDGNFLLVDCELLGKQHSIPHLSLKGDRQRPEYRVQSTEYKDRDKQTTYNANTG